MIKKTHFSVSNIGLPSFQHGAFLKQVKELGFDGIEVAPSRVWRDTWKGLKASDVSAYRRQIEDAGLQVVGLHSLFFDQPDLTIFGDEQTRLESISFLTHLSGVCRDLGGRILVFGSPSARRRGSMTLQKSLDIAARTFEELGSRVEGHGTVFCMEPLGPTETDFCNSLADIENLYSHIDSDIFQFQFDVRALSANNEMLLELFEKYKSQLVHVHINAADLGALDASDGVEHKLAAQYLKRINYTGYLSLEQRSISEIDYMTPLAHSMKFMTEVYS